MNRILLVAVPVAVVLCGGCNKNAAPPSASAPVTSEPVQAQPRLQTMKLWIGPEEMMVELALTPEQQSIGMMYRTNLTENAGMFYPFPTTRFVAFWMKNVSVPLSGAYIDEEGVIRELHQFEPQNTNQIFSATNNIRFVLQTSQGWFEKHNVRMGMIVRTEQGSLMDTFFQSR